MLMSLFRSASLLCLNWSCPLQILREMKWSWSPEEKEFLMSKMFPPMIVGGFTTVTITSVVIAGIFAEMF